MNFLFYSNDDPNADTDGRDGIKHKIKKQD